MRHTPPPPRLAVEGKVTDNVKYIATAASAADPPAANTSRPMSVACGSSDAVPWKALTRADWASLWSRLLVLSFLCVAALVGSEVAFHAPDSLVF